ncbi:MAG: OmpA family protein, partial [Bacteroidota bacterium]
GVPAPSMVTTTKPARTFLAIAMGFSFVAQAQKGKKKLAEEYYQGFQFEKAAEIFEDVLKQDDNDIFALKRAAECRKNIGDYAKAEEHLANLANQSVVRAEDLLIYADILKIQKKYDEALEIYERYMKMKPNDQYVAKYLSTGNWAYEIVRDSGRFEITNSKVNSQYSDFAPCFVEGKVIFSSARKQGKGSKKKYNWTDQSYLNLYTADILKDSSLHNVNIADSEANSRFHEGTVAYDYTNKEIYFTRNNYHKGEKNQGDDGQLNLAIFYGDYENGELGKLKEFPFNNEEYSVGHPTITSDGNTMYFTSDMPGGQGGTDIYKVTRSGDSWTKPENLGPQINTPNDEMFPFVDDAGTLYFASNGHPGLGGLDLFYLDGTSNNEVTNFGYPVNSSFDDFGMITFADGRVGYFSSNRPGGLGDDDIYEFVVRKAAVIRVAGLVVDAETQEPIANSTILLKDENNEKVLQVVANADGEGSYFFDVEYDKTYTIIGVKNGYFQKEIKLTTNDRSGFIDASNIELTKYAYASEGKVLIAETNEPAEGALVSLYDLEGNVVAQTLTLVNGEYFFGLQPESQYTLVAEKEPFPKQEIALDTRGRPATIVYSDFRLFMIEKGAVVRLDNIYYDYNKATLRPEAERELDRLVKIMMDNPTMTIELGSHTDARGSSSYNLSLSKRRAKSAVDYLISRGISRSRLVPKGYGETRLLNRCTDNAECSDEEHARNRRTEFTILNI